MQPDYSNLSHWPPLSQNCWFYPPTGSSPYFPVPELHPNTLRSTGHYSEQMVRTPSGEKPEIRTPQLGSFRGLSPSFPPPTSYLPSHGSSLFPARGPQDLLPSSADAFRLLERGTVSPQYSSFNSLLEQSTDSTKKDFPRLEDNTSLTIDDKAVRPQRGRTVFSAHQLHELENVFVIDQYISGQQRRRLSAQLGLTETQVRVWFQNRRIKWRKNRMERTMKL